MSEVVIFRTPINSQTAGVLFSSRALWSAAKKTQRKFRRGGEPPLGDGGAFAEEFLRQVFSAWSAGTRRKESPRRTLPTVSRSVTEVLSSTGTRGKIITDTIPGFRIKSGMTLMKRCCRSTMLWIVLVRLSTPTTLLLLYPTRPCINSCIPFFQKLEFYGPDTDAFEMPTGWKQAYIYPDEPRPSFS